MKLLLCVVGGALLMGGEAWPPVAPHAPLVGFSFSPLTSQWAGHDPVADLDQLLERTDPDLVRVPIYWESVQPSPDDLDFSSVDTLLAAIALHNEGAPVKTRVVLTVGARNFLHPELHEPAWASPRQQPHLNDLQSGPVYRTYFDSSVMRYRDSPLLYAWQVENEPFDYVVNQLTGDDVIDAAQLAWEIGEVHLLDPDHEAMTTTFDGWNVGIDALQLYSPPIPALLGAYPSGHPGDSLAAADALGLDIYVDSPSTPLRFTAPSLRAEWKLQAIDFWATRASAAGKDLWLSEMQAAPWGTGFSTFTPADLVTSAAIFRRAPFSVVLLWGSDTWLQDPSWFAAATRALAVLRGD